MDIQAEILSILSVIITACVAGATKSLMSYLDKKGAIAKLETHKGLADIAVNAVEQTYKYFNGEEKLNLAKIEVLRMAQEKGIKISESEIDLLIESAVKGMNVAVKEMKN